MAQVALNIYRKGHIPVIGEWLALPLAKAAGSKNRRSDQRRVFISRRPSFD
jgi:hypothetical protein